MPMTTMPTDLQVNAALASLQLITQAANAYGHALALLDADEDAALAAIERAKSLVFEALPALDKYLTSANDYWPEIRRHLDSREFDDLEGGTATFYLSDGGYSRLILNLPERQLYLDSGLSLPRAMSRFDALMALQHVW